jgi:DNA-binding MarR family transcriptional regulator
MVVPKTDAGFVDEDADCAERGAVPEISAGLASAVIPNARRVKVVICISPYQYFVYECFYNLAAESILSITSIFGYPTSMTDKPSPTPLEQLLCFNIYSLNRALNRHYQAIFGDTGMSYPKFVVLSALEEAEPLTVSKLSEYVGMEPSTLSPLLKRMAEYGVLTRSRSAEDERKVVIELTDMGRRSVVLVREAVFEALKDLDLDPSQTSQLVKTIGAIRTRVDVADPERRLNADGMPPPLPEC